jgi:hypothetical protein
MFNKVGCTNIVHMQVNNYFLLMYCCVAALNRQKYHFFSYKIKEQESGTGHILEEGVNNSGRGRR